MRSRVVVSDQLGSFLGTLPLMDWSQLYEFLAFSPTGGRLEASTNSIGTEYTVHRKADTISLST